MDQPADKRVSPKSILMGVGILAVFAWCYHRTFYEMWLRWFPAWKYSQWSVYDRLFEGEGYYTHGPLVVLISALIAVMLLRFTKIRTQPSPKFGAVVLIGSVMVHWLAALAQVNFLSAMTIPSTLAGGVLILWGRDALKRLAFPLLFLFFMVPMPEVLIAGLNFELKMFTVDGSVKLFTFLGGIAERLDNEVVLLGDKTLVVANVCNGLRSLISLLAFGVLYAYVCKVRGLWRWVLLFASLPVALVCNAIRIMSLILVADVVSVEVASGWYHDLSGVMLYPLAILILFSFEAFILWTHARLKHPIVVRPLFDGLRRTDDDLGQAHAMVRGFATRRALVLLVLVAGAAGGTKWLHSTEKSYDRDSARLSQLVTKTLTIGGGEWASEDLDLDKKTLAILQNPDYLRRRYASMGRGTMELMILYSRNNRKGNHPPDLCIEGSGQEVFKKQSVEVRTNGGQSVWCQELQAKESPKHRRVGEPRKRFVHL
ncbi:MAG: exosortase, partial [Phycisphaerales bacterium]|nr:exosortase [Phycisphaerales bacterium]